MEKIGATPIGNGNLDAIRERKRRLVKNPNMDYRNLYATNLFRDIMIILVVNIGSVGIQTADYYYNGAGILNASNFHQCMLLRRSDSQIFSLQHHYQRAQSYSNRIIIQK